MTTALPTFLADPSLSTTASPPPQPLPTTSESHPPNHDLEAANPPQPTALPPATSLPPTTAPSTNARTSLSSTHSTTSSIPWGSSHPCFPHPNPHVPRTSPLATSTRIIRVPRTWTTYGDLAPQYSNTYPEILEPWVSEQDFRTLVSRINEGLAGAFGAEGLDSGGGDGNGDGKGKKGWGMGGWTEWKDLLLGVATGWLWEDLAGEWGLGVKRGVRGVERAIEEWNREREGSGDGSGGGGEGGEGAKCWGLRRTGYLSLDIQIPDPHVRVVGSGEEVEGEGEEKEGREHQVEETEREEGTVKAEGDGEGPRV